MKNRCINIDWLELFVKEPANLNSEYFKRKGYKVECRCYGTPQYREMFTVFIDNFPTYEIRRNPYSVKGNGGIFEKDDCHIRLTNRACYNPCAINDLRTFLLAHNYEIRNVSRIDICLDFNVFDDEQKPELLVKYYMEAIVFKLNQCNISAHGKEKMTGNLWNSLKWGSETSGVTTKLYNKTLELKEKTNKSYIIDQWRDANLDLESDVWRVEFSLKNAVKGFVRLDTGEFIKMSLTTFDSKNKCLFLFHSLCNKYFNFKIKTYSKEGNLLRKSRCKPYYTFKLSKDKCAYVAKKLKSSVDCNRTDKILINRLEKIETQEGIDVKVRKMASSLKSYLCYQMNLKDRNWMELEGAEVTRYMTKEQYEDYITIVEKHQREMRDLYIMTHVVPDEYECPF